MLVSAVFASGLVAACQPPPCAVDSDCGDGAVCDAGACSALGPLISIESTLVPGDSPCASGANGVLFRECAVGFGAVPLGTTATRSITILNPSPRPLLVESVVFDSSSDPSFSVDGAGIDDVTIAPNERVVVDIAFSPMATSSVSASLRIRSDGRNLDDGEDVVVAISASGGPCQPDLEVTPPSCDFGAVRVFETGVCDLTIRNRNVCDAVGASFATTPFPVFSLADVGDPLIIPPSGISVRVTASPSTLGLISGSFNFEAIGNGSVVNIPLEVEGLPPADGFFASLSWNSADCDLHLHLLRDGTDWCGANDCFADQATLDWGGGRANPRFERGAPAPRRSASRPPPTAPTPSALISAPVPPARRW